MTTQNQHPEKDPDALAPTLNQQNASMKRAARASNKYEALKLRRLGMGFRQIGQRLGVNEQTASAWVRDAIRTAPVEDVEDVRALELDRLDSMLGKHLSQAIAGDARSGEFVLKVMERRAKYLNLDTSVAAGVEAVGSLLDRLVAGE